MYQTSSNCSYYKFLQFHFYQLLTHSVHVIVVLYCRLQFRTNHDSILFIIFLWIHSFSFFVFHFQLSYCICIDSSSFFLLLYVYVFIYSVVGSWFAYSLFVLCLVFFWRKKRFMMCIVKCIIYCNVCLTQGFCLRFLDPRLLVGGLLWNCLCQHFNMSVCQETFFLRNGS